MTAQEKRTGGHPAANPIKTVVMGLSDSRHPQNARFYSPKGGRDDG